MKINLIPNPRFRRTLPFGALLLLMIPALCGPLHGGAEDDVQQISVIDTLMSLEISLSSSLGRVSETGRLDETSWEEDYANLYSDYAIPANSFLSSENINLVSLGLGMKATDGVFALKSHDIERLNDCADQMEKLAERMNVDKSALSRAYLAKQHANRKEWAEAFLNLGFLQFDVARYLKQAPDLEDSVTLVTLGGWIQGGRCASDLILDNYNEEVSNTLREPGLVMRLIEQAESMSEETRNDPVVSRILSALPRIHEIVNVGMLDPIPRENMEELNNIFGYLIESSIASAEGSALPGEMPQPATPSEEKAESDKSETATDDFSNQSATLIATPVEESEE